MHGGTARRTRSLQTRVLVLAGAGVFCAGAALTLVSRRNLQALDQRFVEERERVARVAALAVESYVDDDLRSLTRAAARVHGNAAATLDALKMVLHDRPGAACAFFVETGGRVVAAAPPAGCDALHTSTPVARRAALTQRPVVVRSAAIDGAGRIIAAVPYRGLEGAQPGAAAMTIPLPDGGLERLLRQAGAASSLSFQVRTSDGDVVARSGTGATGQPHAGREAIAAVAGTDWIVAAAGAVGGSPSPVESYRRTSLWLAPGLTLVTLLLGWGVAHSVRRPLATLTRSAERIAAGDVTHGIDTEPANAGGEEMARLASAFERMRESLSASMAATAAANEQLERRVADRTRELAQANVRLEERERQRQQLVRKLIAAQEEERRRVARELHDETSQTLAALAIAVDVVERTAEGPPQPLETMRGLVSRTVEGIRRLIVDLRPSVLDDLGLTAAIRSFAAAHLARAGIAVRFEVEDAGLRLPAAIEIAVFRAVQEALVNIERHAAAQTVLIQIAVEGDTFTIDVEDDGVGFAPEAAVADAESLRGFGLLGMRERIELVGGRLRVDSEPGHGTRIVMSVPVVQEMAHV